MTECGPFCRVRIPLYSIVWCGFCGAKKSECCKHCVVWSSVPLLVSFKMYFCCADSKRYGQTDSEKERARAKARKTETEPRISDNIVYLLCNFYVTRFYMCRGSIQQRWANIPCCSHSFLLQLKITQLKQIIRYFWVGSLIYEPLVVCLIWNSVGTQVVHHGCMLACGSNNGNTIFITIVVFFSFNIQYFKSRLCANITECDSGDNCGEPCIRQTNEFNWIVIWVSSRFGSTFNPINNK